MPRRLNHHCMQSIPLYVYLIFATVLSISFSFIPALIFMIPFLLLTLGVFVTVAGIVLFLILYV